MVTTEADSSVLDRGRHEAPVLAQGLDQYVLGTAHPGESTSMRMVLDCGPANVCCNVPVGSPILERNPLNWGGKKPEPCEDSGD